MLPSSLRMVKQVTKNIHTAISQEVTYDKVIRGKSEINKASILIGYKACP